MWLEPIVCSCWLPTLEVVLPGQACPLAVLLMLLLPLAAAAFGARLQRGLLSPRRPGRCDGPGVVAVCGKGCRGGRAGG